MMVQWNQSGLILSEDRRDRHGGRPGLLIYHARSNLRQLRGRLPRLYHRLRNLARFAGPDPPHNGKAALCGSLPLEHPPLPACDRGVAAPLGVFDPSVRAGHGDMPGLCGGMHGWRRAGQCGLRRSVPARRRGVSRRRSDDFGPRFRSGAVKPVAGAGVPGCFAAVSAQKAVGRRNRNVVRTRTGRIVVR